jgi:regulator of ribonuclease activity A
MTLRTTDLCDAHGDKVRVADPIFRTYGGRTGFAGPIATVKVFEDNVLVRAALSEPGNGRVLVIDGGGSLRCALVGGQIAALAEYNGWAGLIVYGCIRDAVEINAAGVGVRALNTHPRKSVKKGEGSADIPVTFGGVTYVPGHWLYADEDGLIVSESALA